MLIESIYVQSRSASTMPRTAFPLQADSNHYAKVTNHIVMVDLVLTIVVTTSSALAGLACPFY